ncbi:hypothetical protein R80B4_00783 [Fibrobacteres bacterium R8-0-B4]
MKKSLFGLLLSAAALQALLLSAGCGGSASKSGTSAAEPRPDAVDPRERYTASGGQTFLDTLNRGREIALAADDLPVLEVVPALSPAPERGADASEPRFRIQILASSQVDMARREKVNAENVMKRQVFMASDQSLYKLYVGDFKTRAEAEAALPEVRKLGYKDAWVVSAKAAQ